MARWLRRINPRGVVLDVGCGTGFAGKILKGHCDRIVGIDASSEMLKVASKTNAYDQLIQVDLNMIDVDTLQEIGQFDAIISTWGTLNYCDRPKEVLELLLSIGRSNLSVGVMAFNRRSLRRILSLKLGSKERYGTRGTPHSFGELSLPSLDHWESCLRCAGVESISVQSLGTLSGIWEAHGLTFVDHQLSRLFGMGHMHLISGYRNVAND